jgi:hypothetical protein
MRAILVVAVDPFLGNFTNLLKRFKDMGIEYFVAVSAVKAFNKGILLWFTGLDKLQFNAFCFALAGEDGRPKFTPVI